MIELLSSMIGASHCFLTGLSIASSYERGSPSIVVEAGILFIGSETRDVYLCTCFVCCDSVCQYWSFL